MLYYYFIRRDKNTWIFEQLRKLSLTEKKSYLFTILSHFFVNVIETNPATVTFFQYGLFKNKSSVYLAFVIHTNIGIFVSIKTVKTFIGAKIEV